MKLETITRHELDGVKYQDLKETFKKLGIETEFKQGKKKVDLLNQAWKDICTKREQIEAGLNAEQIEKDNEKRKAIKEAAKKMNDIQKELAKEREIQKVVEEQEEKPMSKEQIEFFIKKIELSLAIKKKTKGQRAASLKKLAMLKIKLNTFS